MNNIYDFQSRDDILDEAYTWVLLFNADTPVTDDDIAALKEWSSRSPAHREALKEAEGFWCEAELLSLLAVPTHQVRRAGLGRFIRRLIGAPSSVEGAGAVMFTRWRAFASVLFLGLGITLVSSLMPVKDSVGNGVYSTAVGEQKLIILRDASQVQLDTHSQVRVAYEDSVRKIHLLRGKAHFDVAKNQERPFEVYAGEGLVRAVGTAFSVYLADSDIEVLVDEGRVDLARLALKPEQHVLADQVIPAARVQPGKVFMSLERGQGVQFNRVEQEFMQLSDKDLNNKLAWRKGVLVFVRDPLVDVISEVGRYTNVKIEIVDPALRDLVMGGRFRVGELDALLDVLDIGFGVQVSYLSEQHIQLRFRTND